MPHPSEKTNCPNSTINQALPHSWLWLSGLAAALCLVLAAIGWRAYSTYQSPDNLAASGEGYCDFHNGVYFPALAFRQGTSPYGLAFQENYPVVRPMAVYGPALFALHVPFTWLDLPQADLAHYLFQIVCVLVLAAISVGRLNLRYRLVVGLAMALMIAASRSGYGTLVTGYFTLLLVIGTTLAWQTRWPLWLRAMGYAVAACKPTYAIPLSLLLLARRQYSALALGLLIFSVTNAAAVGWLLAQPGASIEQLVGDLREGQAQHVADPNEQPVNSWTRIDLLAIVAKWLNWQPSELEHLVWMLPLIAVPLWLIWRSRSNGRDESPWLEITAMLTLVVSVYHHYYDLLVVVPAWVGLAGSWWNRRLVPPNIRMAPWSGALVLLLVAGSMFHYGSAKFVLDRLEPSPLWFAILTSLNAVVLALALVISCRALREAELPRGT